MAVVFPDAINDLRYWLRRHPDLTPFTNGRVVFRIPKDPVFPLQRIYRTGGAVQQGGGGAPIQDILVSIECWHNLLTGYDTLRRLVAATESAVFTLPSKTLLSPIGNTLAIDAICTNVIDSPDPSDGWPRFIVDTRFTVTLAN